MVVVLIVCVAVLAAVTLTVAVAAWRHGVIETDRPFTDDDVLVVRQRMREQGGLRRSA